jgi:hypothetical protein
MFTANEELVPICVFPEMKLFFPKQNYNVLSPSSSYICEIFIYFQDRSACSAAWKYHRHMNVEIEPEAEQFSEKEYINVIFLALLNLIKILERTFLPMKNYTVRTLYAHCSLKL